MDSLPARRREVLPKLLVHGRHPLVIKAYLRVLVKNNTLQVFTRKYSGGVVRRVGDPVLGTALSRCEGSLWARGRAEGQAGGGQVQRQSLRAEQPLVSSSDDSEAKFSARYKHSSRSTNTARQSRAEAGPLPAPLRWRGPGLRGLPSAGGCCPHCPQSPSPSSC